MTAVSATLRQSLAGLAFYGRFLVSFTQPGYRLRRVFWPKFTADFRGQHWLVTGGSGGIGRALVFAALRGGARNAQMLGRLFQRTAGEESQFDNAGLIRMLDFEIPQRIVKRQQVELLVSHGSNNFGQSQPSQSSAPLLRCAPAGAVHQNAPHGLGGGSEEMPAAIPLPGSVRVDESEIRLVHERRGLERLARLLTSQILGRQPAELVVDQGQQLTGGARIAAFDGRQYACDFAHRAPAPYEISLVDPKRRSMVQRGLAERNPQRRRLPMARVRSVMGLKGKARP